MDYGATSTYRPGLASRLQGGLIQARDWLDARGRIAWIAAMIAGFVFVWPVGLAILLYMIGSNRMFTCSNRRKSARRNVSTPTGNSAFDAYRDETLKRLEQEHREFMDYMVRLREARDKAEFDQFLNERREADDRPVTL
ncbi:MAG: DUF2852 domain-containing protein [Paracoccus denitrificans]|uniref:DUF2852 domain-containing protein n=1 Tax=Paracoccus denitrificans TaxID=266 RepID=A0A533IDG3_PARDE|nr:MAG: DUF2852 domain-containing protein [Paracoccus denitrificans]